MTINQAREKFIALMQEVEKELGANITDVYLWKETYQASFNGAYIDKNDYHASITFGDKRKDD